MPNKNQAGLFIEANDINHAEIVDIESAAAAEEDDFESGMVLPFQPITLAFSHINYYIDMPAVSLLVYSLFAFNLYYIFYLCQRRPCLDSKLYRRRTRLLRRIFKLSFWRIEILLKGHAESGRPKNLHFLRTDKCSKFQVQCNQ